MSRRRLRAYRSDSTVDNLSREGNEFDVVERLFQALSEGIASAARKYGAAIPGIDHKGRSSLLVDKRHCFQKNEIVSAGVRH